MLWTCEYSLLNIVAVVTSFLNMFAVSQKLKKLVLTVEEILYVQIRIFFPDILILTGLP